MGSLKRVKSFDDLTHKQWIALGTKMGGVQKVIAVLQGDKNVILEDICVLVDKNGRCIPQRGVVTANVCDPSADYRFEGLTGYVNYATIILMWEALFEQKAGMTPVEFEQRIEAIKQRVATWSMASKPQIANLFAGPHFPIILPQLPAGDHGIIIRNHILPVVERAYLMAFHNGEFTSNRHEDLAENTKIVDERHAKLVADLEQGPIPGIMCYPLQGFDIIAQQQMAALMPDFISLAGAIEPGVTLALYPKLLAGAKTPNQDCSAIRWQPGLLDPSTLLYISRSYPDGDDECSFDGPYNLNDVYGHHSGGFFVRG
ncbi:MAG: hypothetical protein WC310_03875 [Patescibacteria group bacterium]